MTLNPARRSLFRALLLATVLCASCARSAIEEEDEGDAYSYLEAGDQEEAGEASAPEQEAGAPDTPDAGAPPDDDGGGGMEDGGGSMEDAAVPDGGAPMMDSSAPAEAGPADAGAPDSGTPDGGTPVADAGPRDAGVDAAPDAAPPAPKCTAGSYKGAFAGLVLVEFIIPFYEITLTGEITLTLAPEAGDRFAVRDGRVTGADTEGNELTATVTGSVNCATGNIENGRLMGTYIRPPIFNEITFTGTVSGKYVNASPAANGTWETETSSTDLLKGGNGTWNVLLIP